MGEAAVELVGDCVVSMQDQPSQTPGPESPSAKRPKIEETSEIVLPDAVPAPPTSECVMLTPFDPTDPTPAATPATVHQPGPVLICKTDKTHVQLSVDRLTVKSQRGYRMVRATHGVGEGSWYYEAKIVHLGPTGHCRAGWCTSKADTQAPVDQNGYAYRDLEGCKVHKGLRESYAEPYAAGDTIGFYIHLPPTSTVPTEPPPKEVVEWKGVPYQVEAPEVPPKALKGSLVAFSKNGKMQGVAYRDILEGSYFAAVSLYTLPNPEKLAEVRFNFGPDFEYPPVPVEEGLPVPKAVSEVALLPQKEPTLALEGDPLLDTGTLDPTPSGGELNSNDGNDGGRLGMDTDTLSQDTKPVIEGCLDNDVP
mmetsp:Transcript_33688/g.63441  ORF Transcript_33688/g.63441 Transcript_33688/m.63441 type:complete len:365 (+) Transcript_33688:105-1199(+)